MGEQPRRGGNPIQKTSWTIIERAADGDAAARDRFAGIYTPALKAYFAKRWEGLPTVRSVEDAVQDVFLDCFRPNGVLDRAEHARAGGFRAFFYGVARTVALRCEQAHNQQTKRCPATGFDTDCVRADDDSLTKIFDRVWARSIVREAVLVHREQGRAFDGREKLRVEILRLRFEMGRPIREIARELNLTPELAHKEYARARKSFRAVLEHVVAAHLPGDSADITERCREVLRLLG